MGKTALKLLLVFVEYTESNSRVLYEGIQAVDSNQGKDFCKHLKGTGIIVFWKKRPLQFPKVLNLSGLWVQSSCKLSDKLRYMHKSSVDKLWSCKGVGALSKHNAACMLLFCVNNL